MKKKILIVEDEKTLINVLVDKLTKEGYDINSAKNGQEGLSLALKNHPDLILLDIIMPIMDGMTMLDELRNVKIIILTNLSDAEKEAQSSEKGVFDYMVKCDMTIDDIVKKVKEKLT
jgi:two-component system, OmpR family, response regulator ResD